jgi:hypothetical protein
MNALEIINMDLWASEPETEVSAQYNWEGSRFEDLRGRQLGRFGELFVEDLLTIQGHSVGPAEDTAFDLRVDGRRAEVKTYKDRARKVQPTVDDVYPHNWDDLYVVHVSPERLRLLHFSNTHAEHMLGARHKLPVRGGEVLLDVEVPRR